MEQVSGNELFINRELSWLEFNRRVLDLAKDKTVPVGEQLKFAAIYASNLDEFFMVRVGSLHDRTLVAADEAENKTGMTPRQQLDAIMPKAAELQQHCDKIVAKLYEKVGALGYRKVNFDHLDKEEERFWKKYFMQEIFPVLSPQVIDIRHPFPFLRNNDLYVGVLLHHKGEEHSSLGIIPINSQFQRVVFMPANGVVSFALSEELIAHFAGQVFGKHAVQGSCVFRVTRNADISVDEGMFDQDVDYRDIMSDLLKKRRRLAAVRLQLSPHAPKEITGLLCEKLDLPQAQVFEQSSPLDLSVGFKLAARLAQDGDKNLFYPNCRPMMPPAGFSLTRAVEQQDVLLAYPYQSIRPFLRMLHEAAHDPDVVSIKMTLYRVAQESKIIEALISAAENGKEVVAIVELRARFDEQNNIDYSKLLEEAGCTVIYGFEAYKVHSKLTLITKKKAGVLSYISQIGTGNYNEKTSEQYTDLSFITTDFTIGSDLAAVFNNLAVERLSQNTGDLLIAPLCFKSVLMKEMDAEIEAKKAGRPARIVIKCNSVSDKDIICKISQASCAGVPVQMIVRGICCLKAGVPGLTENVTVRSIVGRYLEHSRVYAFGTGGAERVYIASGDFLTRNTERRVEAGVRIRDRRIADDLMRMIEMQLQDNVNAREMQPDGSYPKVKRAEGEMRIDSQGDMYRMLENKWPSVQPDERNRQDTYAAAGKETDLQPEPTPAPKMTQTAPLPQREDPQTQEEPQNTGVHPNEPQPIPHPETAPEALRPTAQQLLQKLQPGRAYAEKTIPPEKAQPEELHAEKTEQPREIPQDTAAKNQPEEPRPSCENTKTAAVSARHTAPVRHRKNAPHRQNMLFKTIQIFFKK